VLRYVQDVEELKGGSKFKGNNKPHTLSRFGNSQNVKTTFLAASPDANSCLAFRNCEIDLGFKVGLLIFSRRALALPQ
jgi:hypothetical protein